MTSTSLSDLHRALLRTLPGPHGVGLAVVDIVLAIKSAPATTRYHMAVGDAERELTTLRGAGLVSLDGTTDRWARTQEGDAALGVQPQAPPQADVSVPQLVARAFGALNEVLADVATPAGKSYTLLLVPAQPDEPVLASVGGKPVEPSKVAPMALVRWALDGRWAAALAALGSTQAVADGDGCHPSAGEAGAKDRR